MGTVDNIFVLYGIIIHTLNDGNFDSVVRENLYVSGNSVTDINVSGNSVTDINVSGNSVTDINVSGNSVTDMNVSGNS